MQRSLAFGAYLLFSSLLLALLLYSGRQQADTVAEHYFPANRQLVKQLGLTDLSIWSEARYTRHPSQADLFTAFQDYPGAFDHFPAGSIIGPGCLQGSPSLSFQKRGQP
ncbi:hypothetical protein [Malonomonas rubra]|uniref:hypothetical protein n=1 Tax=Malonomonas rubra TaxID=57040 RepID=UPI0026F0E34B|nr:hypothetical protein [Malonomonas rubra]